MQAYFFILNHLVCRLLISDEGTYQQNTRSVLLYSSDLTKTQHRYMIVSPISSVHCETLVILKSIFELNGSPEQNKIAF